MAWESPNFLKEYESAKGSTSINSTNTKETDSSKYPSYIKYVESGEVPTGFKEGTTRFDDFRKEAEK